MLIEDDAKPETGRPDANLTRQSSAGAEKRDSGLLAAVAEGDEAAFADLYRAHSTAVFNYLLRLIHDERLAEDLLQDTFVAVWQGAGAFGRRAKVKTWILRIAHNKAVSWLRRNRPESMAEETEIISQELEPESLVLLSSRNDELLAALDSLSATHRAVVELVFVHELSYKEIGQIMDCPVGTVKSRMSYALQHLQRILLRSEP